MANTYFKFKQFTVYHDRCAMKIGTDGVLIGAWASRYLKSSRRILDIGCGCGIIALMAAQCSKAAVDAVEIEQEAAGQAEENFKNSPWSDRLTVYPVSLQKYAADCKKRYDVIISNPPYFIRSLKSEDLTRTVARHTELLPFRDLLDGVLHLLKKEGTFFAIFPYQEANLFIVQAALKGLYCVERIDVRSSPRRPVKRVMLRMQRALQEPVLHELAIENEISHDFSAAYRAMTADFYLHF